MASAAPNSNASHRSIAVVALGFGVLAFVNFLFGPVLLHPHAQDLAGSFLGTWIGIVTAEFTMLGAFLVFGRQRVFRRAVAVWLVAILLFVPWLLGIILVSWHAPTLSRDRFLHGLGLDAYGVIVQIVAAVVGTGAVWFVQKFEISPKTRLSFIEQFLHISIAEMLWLTAIVATTLGLLRWLLPIQTASYFHVTEARLQAILMFAVLNAMSPCVMFALIHFLALQERKKWRPRILGALLVGQLGLIVLEFLSPHDDALKILFLGAAAGCSYAATLLASWLVANWAGWELDWD